jgi:hypothetical protein
MLQNIPFIKAPDSSKDTEIEPELSLMDISADPRQNLLDLRRQNLAGGSVSEECYNEYPFLIIQPIDCHYCIKAALGKKYSEAEFMIRLM